MSDIAGETFGKFAMICSNEWVLVGFTTTRYGNAVYYIGEAHESNNMPLEALQEKLENQ